MRNRFYFWILFLSGIVLLVFAIAAGFREATPEWSVHQKEYKKQLANALKDKAAKAKARGLTVEVQQLYLAGLGRVDRCTSCHIGAEDPLMRGAKTPLRAHSGDYLKNHPPEKFGCTVCHYGQGRATNRSEAHGAGRETHWDFPLMPAKYIQSSCVQCHEPGALANKGWDRVAKGLRLVNEKGCRGCHKLDGVGGVLGKALEEVGSKPIAYFPMGAVQGDKTTYNWFRQHFIDPRSVAPSSEMKVSVTEEEADSLTAFALALRSGEMPKKFRRLEYAESQSASSDDGETLYKKYCFACHQTGKDSLYDEIFDRTIPAIMNPALLRTLDNRHLTKIIADGRAGTKMTSWQQTAAGLSDKEIETLVAYIASERPAARPAAFVMSSLKGDQKHGETLYRVRCALCHGRRGEGGLGLNLRNPAVQSFDPEAIAMTVRDGRSGTPMPSFGKDGAGLPDRDIADVVTYVKALAQVK